MAKKNKVTLVGICAVLALALSSGAIIRQFATEKTTELASYKYSICALTAEGELDKEDKSAIVSDLLDVSKLESIEVAEDAEVSVYVYWYDEDGEFLTSEEVTETFTVSETAAKFRVAIKPLDDEDGEVSLLEKSAYAKPVTVTLKK